MSRQLFPVIADLIQSSYAECMDLKSRVEPVFSQEEIIMQEEITKQSVSTFCDLYMKYHEQMQRALARIDDINTMIFVLSPDNRDGRNSLQTTKTMLENKVRSTLLRLKNATTLYNIMLRAYEEPVSWERTYRIQRAFGTAEKEYSELKDLLPNFTKWLSDLSCPNSNSLNAVHTTLNRRRFTS